MEKQLSESKNKVSKNTEFFDSIMRVHRNLKRCADIVNPNSYGRGQGRALQYIADNEGITAHRLANLMDIRPPSLTSRLRPLEADNMIKKIRDKSDARVVRIYITDKGIEALAKRKSGHKQVERDFCSCLTPEEQLLFIDMCNRLSDNLIRLQKEEEERKKEMIKLSIS